MDGDREKDRLTSQDLGFATNVLVFASPKQWSKECWKCLCAMGLCLETTKLLNYSVETSAVVAVGAHSLSADQADFNGLFPRIQKSMLGSPSHKIFAADHQRGQNVHSHPLPQHS